ncbi:MAG TPA: VOC family protein [Thermomicrobiales bacterium]|nr:VOC family protein [Thermomicrobiales bacterium]
MLAQIDHIVLLVNNLPDATANAAAAGFTVSSGGKHDSGGTHNALIPFRDGTYIELLAFDEPPPPDHYFARRLELGPGLADLACLSTDLDADLGAMKARGIAFPDPVSLSRIRPDGVQVAWRMSLPATMYPGKGYPFLIEDTSDRALRVSGDPAHANGVTGVAGVSLVTTDVDADAQVMAALLGVPDVASRFGHAGKGIVVLPFGTAGQWIALVQAMPETAAQAHHEQFGAGPYAISLRTDTSPAAGPWDGTTIDPALVSGARILIA